ncbi:MAG: hypothetical protein QXI91_01765 [Candidatus Bathyarchaeia archaeon]
MIPNSIPTFIWLTIGILTFLFIMLLPALIELKKPKDAGPRIIMDYTFDIQPKNVWIIDMEEEQRFNQTSAEKLVDIISFLPNIEA